MAVTHSQGETERVGDKAEVGRARPKEMLATGENVVCGKQMRILVLLPF